MSSLFRFFLFQTRIRCRTPECRDYFPVLFIFCLLDPPRTNRTATLSRSGTRINHGLPDMTFRTLPPHLAVRASCYTVRCKRPVQCRMPLFSDLRVQGCQVIKARQDFSSRAIWTTGSAHSSCSNHCLIRMPKFTLPPHFSVCIGCDLLRCESSVLLSMPLRCDLWELAGQIIFSGYDFASCTYRATIPSQCPRIHRGLPLVSFLANPPDFASAPRSNITCCTDSIFCGMPLHGNLWKLCCQIIFLRNHHTIGTNRTSTARNPRFDRRFPLVSTLAHPPNRFMTARKHLLWRDFVACRMPLTS